jgi:hypothetical protein
MKAHVTLGVNTNFILYDTDDSSRTMWLLGAYPSLKTVVDSWGADTSEKGKIMVRSLDTPSKLSYGI